MPEQENNTVRRTMTTTGDTAIIPQKEETDSQNENTSTTTDSRSTFDVFGEEIRLGNNRLNKEDLIIGLQVLILVILWQK